MTETQNAFNRLHEATKGGDKQNAKKETNDCPKDPFLESVYSLIPEVYAADAKLKRYRSKYADQARIDSHCHSKKAASMGPLKVTLQSQAHYLRKGNGVTKPEVAREIQRANISRKPAVPNLHEIHKVPYCTKDFVRQNALDNINSFPKVVSELSSPLKKKDYGRTPEYLKERMAFKKEIELVLAKNLSLKKDRAEIDALEERGIVVLAAEEQSNILKGLNDNWARLNKEYQKLSLTVDTVPKITRKVTMEKQLKEYENLINRFSNTKIHVDLTRN